VFPGSRNITRFSPFRIRIVNIPHPPPSCFTGETRLFSTFRMFLIFLSFLLGIGKNVPHPRGFFGEEELSKLHKTVRNEQKWSRNGT